MKTLITLTSVLFLASAIAALAAPIPEIQCHSKNVGDDGFDLDVQTGLTRADLYADTIDGRNLIGRLACRSTRSPLANVVPVFLTCSGSANGIGDVVVRLIRTGNAENPEAVLRQIARDGSEHDVQFGSLQCSVGER